MYNCGPTVYDYAHIGNFRSYIFADLLRRYLEFRGFKLRQIMNITDVDDKTIKGARSAGMTLKEFTDKYEDAFFEDLAKLRIKRAEVYPRATEHIGEMVSLIEALLERGIAYKTEDGIYFKISKFRDYGKLSHFHIKQLKAGARVSQDNYDKEHAQDFALWKFHSADDGDVFWENMLGKGRPGWHIECSAMSRKYLGDTLDIHTGGVDLIFPHHENEIAQSEASTGKKFVRFWVHCEHLLVNGRKMSKSLGNFYTLRDVLERGYNPSAVRYLLMSTHYRSQLNFTFDSLKAAEETVSKLNDFVSRMNDLAEKLKTQKIKSNRKIPQIVKAAKQKFIKYMDDDLDVAKALPLIFGMINKVNKEVDAKKADAKSLRLVINFILEVNKIFDIIKTSEEKLSKEEEALIERREQLRKEKRFKEADEIRAELKKRGILLEDTPHGVRWKKA